MKKMYYTSPKTAETALLHQQILCASAPEPEQRVTGTVVHGGDSSGDVSKAF